MRLLGISGSLRRDSHNSALLRSAARRLPDGVELELWDGLKAIPPYDEDDDVADAPPPVTALREAIAGADAVLFSTPEYNSSVPGQLKNALDWVSRPLARNPLRNKPVAVIGASTGAFGAVWSQAELRKVLGTIGARVVDGELALGHAHTQLTGVDGGLLEGPVCDGLAALIGELVDAVEARHRAVAA
jgi:chromate reductase